MRTHELARLLLDNPDVDIILQKDEEGNGFKRCRGVDFNAIFVEDEVMDLAWSADDCLLEEGEWEEMKLTNPKVAVLFP
jgi:hypothetical protein